MDLTTVFPYSLAEEDKEPPTTAVEPVFVYPDPTGEHTLHLLFAVTPLLWQWANRCELGIR